ncbi:MAG: hypothetical protein PHC46_04815 [Clostridia bacterium]|nr:hypothetical protein [Clostridia bacterium]
MTTIITKIKLYDNEIKKSITKKVPRNLQEKNITELQEHYNTPTETIYWWATQIKLSKTT